MNIIEFIKDKLSEIIFSFFSGAAILFYMYLLNVQSDIVLLLSLAFFFVFTVYWLGNFRFTRRKFAKIERILDKLEKKYLIADVLPTQLCYQDKFYKELLRRACKSMMDEIAAEENKNLDYEEYTANWVHEVKTPITAIQLLCDNDRNATTDRIKLETKKIELDVEQMLYYSKAGEAWKDYMITRQSLNDIVEAAIFRIYQLMIFNRIRLENTLSDEQVYTDAKWSSFIITQLLQNCIRYKNETAPLITISAKKSKDGTSLIIEDNGLGIKADELGHIFEKGYVGTNGRKNETSSGMGLYLCKKLCDRLSIGIRAESEYGAYTRIILTYGEGSFYLRDTE